MANTILMLMENSLNDMKLILFIAFLCIGCETNSKLSSNEITSLESSVIANGDVRSYHKLIRHFDDSSEYYQLLPYSIHMAINHKNADAYYQIYRDLIRVKNKGRYDMRLIKNLDNNSQKFALGSLIQGAKLNDRDCQDVLAEHYKNGWGIVQSSAKADSIIATYR